jgi:hypothetical protein
VKPGILSSIPKDRDEDAFHFPEIMLNIIMSPPDGE